MIEAETGKTLTYAELDRRSRQLARFLRDAGFGVGDHIAILLENRVEYPEVAWAAQRSGLYFTPLNIQLHPSEAAWIVGDCEARAVITSRAQAETARLLQAECPEVEHWLMMDDPTDGFVSYEATIGAVADEPLEDETEGNPMIYSSGTTGRPKGVKRPLTGRVPGHTLAGNDVRVGQAYTLTESSVSLVPNPAYHSAGMTRILLSHSVGATVVIMKKFDAETALATIEKYRVTNAIFVPTMLIRMLRLAEDVRSRYDRSSLIAVTVGAAACPPHVKRAMIEWWGPIIGESYGGTEGNGMTFITSEEWLSHPGSVGRPVFGAVHIAREDGSECEPGEVGVIYFSGGREFEYHKDPDKTASVHHAEGWATIGDVGYLDEAGYLYITDRIADVIISGGVNIYSREVEDCLLGHPDVDDVAVIGIPNEEYGEEVKAVVKLRADVPETAGTAELLRQYCRDHMAHYKCPRSFDFVAELPRQWNGKLYKRLLRDQYAAASG
jgi:acyl-CoA synthetase (AMP-forming)/AMP-acid ligase II